MWKNGGGMVAEEWLRNNNCGIMVVEDWLWNGGGRMVVWWNNMCGGMGV